MAQHALHVLDCGTLTFPRSGMYFNGGDEDITAPIPAYLIEHPEGNVASSTRRTHSAAGQGAIWMSLRD